MDIRCKSGLFSLAVVIAMMITALMSGCGQQLDASVGFGWKSLYPDRAGDKIGTLGDPRRRMYEGSGYGERHTSGSESGLSGFRGMETGGGR